MSQITLTSKDEPALRGLVESALLEKARVLQVAIRQTQVKLAAFEKEYEFSTEEFVAAFTAGRLDHSDDFDDWYGEFKLLTRLQSRLTRLQRMETPSASG
ncbi:MAG: hypothetical protein KF893_21880 [Caldilineaceae bacterium]|nr:hypothetical protein [Caldilineaceae bacterium]